ncbi:MAG: nucleotidyltransferase [Betaproteobacteria bacterium]|nr:nucleotidyltransferase [Betaproteobacteria bacterium]
MSAIPSSIQGNDFIDVLLAEIAVRIQLPLSRHSVAEQRYHTIASWLERPDSLLVSRVERMYAQGSMAIGATIASCRKSDEFDIDVLAELRLPVSTPPRRVLDLLYESIRGAQGGRYYSMVERCTRCVQIQYGDDMHVDVTPTILLAEQPERTGFIFHANPAQSSAQDKKILANPYGFAEWFKARTPLDTEFSPYFAELSKSFDLDTKSLLKAESEPVPTPVEAYEKSRALIALQLLKRWRNIRYDHRDGRKPPSVLLAKLVASYANQTNSLFGELLHQAKQILYFFESAQREGKTVYVENPVCRGDVFSDRWPSSLQDQNTFILDLKHLVGQLSRLSARYDVLTAREVLSDLFGERPTVAAVDIANSKFGRTIETGGASHNRRTIGFDIRASGLLGPAAASSTYAANTPGHRFFGGDLESE